MGYYYYGYGFDGYYILILIACACAMLASWHVHSTYRKYAQVYVRSRMTGAETAERILNGAGIYGVQLEEIGGSLTDHYDPSHLTLSLSQSVYSSGSVAAVAVAAHECGHAIQDAEHYFPLTLRTKIVPAVNIASYAAWPLIVLGLFFNASTSNLILDIGIVLFSASVAFQLITLPVEFNASHRALKILENSGILMDDEMEGAKKVLTAAALTYVASAATAILQLLRILAMVRRRDD